MLAETINMLSFGSVAEDFSPELRDGLCLGMLQLRASSASKGNFLS
jgi:hypothetical protein